MPPVAIGIAGAAVMGAGAIAGGRARGKAARAAGQQAFEQQRIAREERRRAMELAEPNALELAAAEKQLQVSERAVARQEKLIDAIDPALIEAGQQALQLLKGQEAATLAPLRRQRERQRAQLVGRLRQQLGAGFESSSAGIEALTRFDEQTSDVLAGAQQQTLGQLLGTSLQAKPSEQGLVQLAGTGLAQQSMFQRRRMEAFLGTSGAITGTAGAQFAAERARQEARAQTFGSISRIGGAALGAGLSGMGRVTPDEGDESTMGVPGGGNATPFIPAFQEQQQTSLPEWLRSPR